jgi:cytoskeletal protein RodZ
MNAKTDYGRGMSPGDCLRKLRLDRELDIVTLAEKTCVNEQVIQCLEQDDWLALPAMVYVRGYVRILCRELGGDARDILRRLDAQTVALHEPVAMVHASTKKWRIGRPVVAAAVVVATVLIGLLTSFIAVPVSGTKTEADTRTSESSVLEEQETQR